MNTQRLNFADNIRTLMIGLVIMVHTAVTYGGEGGWYYQEATNSDITIIGLTLFNALTQSFFMSLLFLIAGFFSQLSIKKTHTSRYLLSRFKRLGIPLLAYYFGIGPFTEWLAVAIEGGIHPNYWNTLHAGPMWFAQALLIFTVVFLIFRAIFNMWNSQEWRVEFSWVGIGLFTLLLFIVTIPLRALWPMGDGIAGMQLGSFGHYFIMYCTGLIAARLNWSTLIESIDLKVVSAFITFGVFLLPVGLVLGFRPESEFTPFMGGLSWQAIFYDGWESLMCVFLSLLTIKIVYQTSHMQSRLWRAMARANYGVYFIHAPILVFISFLLMPLELFALGKFVMASLLTVLTSFPLAWLLTRVPVIRQIL